MRLIMQQKHPNPAECAAHAVSNLARAYAARKAAPAISPARRAELQAQLNLIKLRKAHPGRHHVIAPTPAPGRPEEPDPRASWAEVVDELNASAKAANSGFQIPGDRRWS